MVCRNAHLRDYSELGYKADLIMLSTESVHAPAVPVEN